jgi:hypothetical protein
MKICKDCGKLTRHDHYDGLCVVCNQKRHDQRIANIKVSSIDFDVIQDALDFAMNHHPNQDVKEFERVWRAWLNKASCFEDVAPWR